MIREKPGLETRYGHRFRIMGTLTILLFFVLSVSACQEAKKAEVPSQRKALGYKLDDPEKQDLAILQVKETYYTNSHFITYLQIRAGEDFETLSVESLSRMFDDFVEEKILLEGANQEELFLSDEEKHDYLDRLQHGIPEAERSVLKDEHEIRSFFDRILIEKYTAFLVKEIAVTMDEVRSYYLNNKRKFLRSERVKVSQILCETESDAIGILKRVRDADEGSFRQIARQESLGAESSRGGEMGIFEMNQLPFEMEKIIFSLKKGEVSDVLESVYGFHIFRLDEKLDAELMTQEEALGDIKTALIDRKTEIRLKECLQELKETLVWNTLTGNLTFPYQRTQYE